MSSVAKIFDAWINKSYNNLADKFRIHKNNKRCYHCKKTFPEFTKFRGGFRNLNSWLLSLDMVGSDIDNFGCPHCGINDRVRHLLMYFDRLGVWEKFTNASVIHFAPEEHLVKKIERLGPSRYVKADLFPADERIQKIDITHIPYTDNEFDILICNHVLEHVTHYKKALSEIVRVLRPGGLAILQTPYSRKLTENFEDESINTDELRLQYYGQEDHVRWFSERRLMCEFENAGLIAHRKKHNDLFKEGEHVIFGVNPDEDLFLFYRE
ncbi:class I SAM-dependent methyltransferase [Pollutibacter soli]|uniref:class I SAM-dependent methyltransferase n=1 Tax=Pollutibacter soli TaxID=3034157 RepID=UPI003013688C